MESETTQGLLGPLAWLYANGGTVVAILVGLSVVALAVILLKVWQFARLRLGSTAVLGEGEELWRSGRAGEALERLGTSPHPAARVLETALRGQLRGDVEPATVREEVQRVAAAQLAGLRSHLKVLEVIGALSPLLGLLGTVLGMIEAFQELEAAGSQVDPSVLSGGIWEALLTTAAGLAVAIPVVAVLSLLERIVERTAQLMEDRVTRIFTGALAESGEAGPSAARATQLRPDHAH
ncbi:MAG: MotA/TolQ/ExbB proton channel family protein [Pseudomonadota bacterium]